MTPEELNKLKKSKVFQLLPTIKSKDIEWINWMKALDKDFDRSTAVSIFIKLWEKRGSSDAGTLQLRSFMKEKYNVDLSEGVLDKATDLGAGIMDTVGGIFHAGKVTVMVVGGIILVGAIAVIYNLVKNPSNAAYFTPQGRALKMTGK